MTQPAWTRRLLASAAVMLGAIAAPPSHGFEFTPEPMEFESWPMYCKGRYIETVAGKRSPFANRVPYELRSTMRRQLGDGTWFGVHHYCAGIVYLNRARIQKDASRRDFLLHNALNEVMFSYRNLPLGAPLFSTVVIALSSIEAERGNSVESVQYLDLAKSRNPSDPAVHISIGLAYRDMKDLPSAKAALLEGLTATEGQSLELRYNLGLICLEMNDIDCAVEQAKSCYSEDYPMFGLRNRLTALGRWPPEQQ